MASPAGATPTLTPIGSLPGVATTTFPADKRDRYLELMAAGWSKSRACRELGITPGAVRYAIEHHDDFADALELIDVQRIDDAEEKLSDLVEQHDFRAIKFTLENLQPERWARARHRPRTDDPEPGQSPITIAKMNVTVIAGVLDQYRDTGLSFIREALAIEPVHDELPTPELVTGDEPVDATVVP